MMAGRGQSKSNPLLNESSYNPSTGDSDRGRLTRILAPPRGRSVTTDPGQASSVPARTLSMTTEPADVLTPPLENPESHLRRRTTATELPRQTRSSEKTNMAERSPEVRVGLLQIESVQGITSTGSPTKKPTHWVSPKPGKEYNRR